MAPSDLPTILSTMNRFSTIVRDFKAAPLAAKSVNVKPAKVTHVQSRAEVKKAMSAGLARSK